jgi:hypothetical protein
MLREVKEIFEKEDQDIKIYSSDISIKYAMDTSTLSQYHFSEMDYRVRLKQYEGKFVCAMVVDNNTKNILAFQNYIFPNSQDFKTIYFWKFEEEINMLKRISITDILPSGIKTAMTTGFTVIPENFFAKIFVTKKFIELTKKLLELGLFSYTEPAGVNNLNLYSEKCFIDISCLKDFDINTLGKTRPKSKGGESFANFLGFTELERIYDIRTLGKVFIRHNQ